MSGQQRATALERISRLEAELGFFVIHARTAAKILEWIIPWAKMTGVECLHAYSILNLPPSISAFIQTSPNAARPHP